MKTFHAKMLWAAAGLGFLCAFTGPVQADLILADPDSVDLNGQGFGSTLTILTLQGATGNGGDASDVEFGGVGWDGTMDVFDNTGGWVLEGSPHSLTREVSELNPLGLSAFDFFIVYNPDEAGNPASDPNRVEDLIVSIWEADGTFIISASLGVDFVHFAEDDAGVGNSGYLFMLDDTQAADFDLADAFSDPTNRIGLFASLSFMDNGPDSFSVVTCETAQQECGPPRDMDVPEPATWPILGASSLVLLVLMRRRRYAWQSVSR